MFCALKWLVYAEKFTRIIFLYYLDLGRFEFTFRSPPFEQTRFFQVCVSLEISEILHISALISKNFNSRYYKGQKVVIYETSLLVFCVSCLHEFFFLNRPGNITIISEILSHFLVRP